MDAYTALFTALATLVGFLILAALVLWPFARLLRREAEEAERWTPEALARRSRPHPGGGDGAPAEPPELPDPAPPVEPR